LTRPDILAGFSLDYHQDVTGGGKMEGLDDLKNYLKDGIDKENIAELNELWECKRRFVTDLLNDLYLHCGAHVKSCLGQQKYKDWKEELGRTSESLPEQYIKGLLVNPCDDPPYNLFSVKYFRNFLTENYTPPDTPSELMNHLAYLSIFYTHLVQDMPLVVTTRIDLSMAKAAYATAKSICATDRSGNTAGGQKVIEQRKEKMHRLVVAVFDEMCSKRKKPKPSMVMNKVNYYFENFHERKELPSISYARLLREVYEVWPQHKKTPSVSESTVRRILKADNRI